MDRRKRLELRLLGRFEAYLDGQPIQGFESDKVRALLAYLAYENDRAHRRESVAALVWPDQPEDVALHRLRQALTNLRAVLGDTKAPLPLLRVSRAELRLDRSDDVELDVVAFKGLLAACRQHPHRSVETCRACVRRMEAAVELCRGTFLEGLSVGESDAFEEWVAARRGEVETLAARALAELAEHHGRRRDHRRVQIYAARRLRFEPWAEEAHRQLMHGLAHNGQRTAALRQYQQCREVLRAELGVEPSGETQTMGRLLERGGLPAAAPEPPHNLPASVAPLIGREGELAALEDLLSAQRLVTLTGMGGCGKTRLALEVAAGMRRDFKDGVWLVELAPVADAAQVPRAVARVFGVGEDAKHSAAENLAAHLRGKDALLVLDNCEQVVGACAALAADLLRACPALCLLATSREALRIAGEHAVEVPPLPVDDLEVTGVSADHLLEVVSASNAVQLFVERAAEVNPDLTLTAETAPAVAGICRELDGIPLALELAATWAGTLSVEEIRARLADRFRLRDRGSRTADARHQTLEGLIDWSYELLTPAERAAFLRLGVFAGGGPLDAAEAVCADGAADEPLRVLRGLTAKSIMRITAHTSGTRFQMLETLRQYARRRLEAAGDSASTAERHARYFLDLAEAAHPALYGPQQVVWLDRLEAESANLAAAADWLVSAAATAGAAELALRLSLALWRYWHVRSHFSEGRRRLAAALDAASRHGISDSVLCARAAAAAGVLAWAQGDFSAAEPLLQRALAHAGAPPDALATALARLGLGHMTRIDGDRLIAREHYAGALALFRQLDEPWGPWGAAATLHNMGHVATDSGDHEGATVLYQESLALRRRGGDRHGIASSLTYLGLNAYHRGNLVESVNALQQSLGVWRDVRDRRSIAETLRYLACALSERGDHAAARAACEESLALRRSIEDRFGIAESLYALGSVALNAGNAAEAAVLLRESLARWRDFPHPPAHMLRACLALLAAAALTRGEPERAATMLGALEGLYGNLADLSWTEEVRAREQTALALQKRTDRATRQAWVRGCALSEEEALSFALAQD